MKSDSLCSFYLYAFKGTLWWKELDAKQLYVTVTFLWLDTIYWNIIIWSSICYTYGLKQSSLNVTIWEANRLASALKEDPTYERRCKNCTFVTVTLLVLVTDWGYLLIWSPMLLTYLPIQVPSNKKMWIGNYRELAFKASPAYSVIRVLKERTEELLIPHSFAFLEWKKEFQHFWKKRNGMRNELVKSAISSFLFFV